MLFSQNITLSSIGRRRAFTLIELILVMGIIVMIASLASPMVTRMLGRQSLKQGADRVRVEMGRARVEAIKTGDVQALFFLPRGNWYNVAPFSQLSQQSGIASREQSLLNNRTYTGYEDNVLPPGIQFVTGSMEVDSRAVATLGDVKVDSDSIQPVLFYPDGTAQDATVYIQDNRRNRVAVVLRGLTGAARTVRIDQ
jgi:prepilin-type N-terminal cleavage/methylation domain-containing protein